MDGLTAEQKEKAMKLAKKIGLTVSFNGNSGVFVINGDKRKRMDIEDFFPELKSK